MSYTPIFHPKVDKLLHGADYNPDQWLHMPEVIDEDFRLMKLARCSIMSVGIFAWAALEPREGEFHFEWLDRIMDRLAENGLYACLATPTGARPRWLAVDYPETNRVGADRVRLLPGMRHNHNYSSPVMIEKAKSINTKLAERYGGHPALLLWHISNEYGGEDHSVDSQQAFRAWLRERYRDDLDALNRAWWSAFWSRTYQDWSQIESPAPHGETAVHGLVLDWKRFVTHQTIEFMRHEIEPLRRIAPNVPLTTNFMETYAGLDYFRFADVLDVASWDAYPQWHTPYPMRPDPDAGDGQAATLDDYERAAHFSFFHDLVRSVKHGRPFMLMESTPSATNWQPYAALKRPGMHRLSCINAVAHGADTIQYFQWRKSRGAFEKFHGAVVDHAGHENTRVFGDVSDVGTVLERIGEVAGSRVPANVAVVFDWENRWAIDEAKGPRNDGRTAYVETVIDHYRAFWKLGIPTDVIDETRPLDAYTIVVAPMVYMLRPGFAERVEKFVAAGGVFVTTYWSGIVDESDLCFLGGFPGPLRSVLGIRSEEIDAPAPGETRRCRYLDGNPLGLSGSFSALELCDVVHTESATALATYESDFYAGHPAATVNRLGDGFAYYLAARSGNRALSQWYGALVAAHPVRRALDAPLPAGVAAAVRENGEHTFLFVQNFRSTASEVELPHGSGGFELIDGKHVDGSIELAPYGVMVIRLD